MQYLVTAEVVIKDIKKNVFYKEFSEDNTKLNDLIELSLRVKSNKEKINR